MTIAIDREEAREAFRSRVLAALDDAAEHLTGEPGVGWTDQDLPAFFKELDKQIERFADRRNIALVEEVLP